MKILVPIIAYLFAGNFALAQNIIIDLCGDSLNANSSLICLSESEQYASPLNPGSEIINNDIKIDSLLNLKH